VKRKGEKGRTIKTPNRKKGEGGDKNKNKKNKQRANKKKGKNIII
jgi:hypothetical protein